MRLDLDHDLPAEDRVFLQEVSAGHAEHREVSSEASDSYLLVGHDVANGTVVGTVLLSTARPMVLVRDFRVPEGRSGQGDGSALLRAVAQWSQARGSHAVGLQLSADDHVARGTVDRLGFRLVEEYCVKDLHPRAS